MSVFVVVAVLATLPPGHPPVGDQAPRSAAELIETLDRDPKLRNAPKPFAIAGAMGRLYYEAGRYADALPFLREALAKVEPARALVRTTSAALPDDCHVSSDQQTEEVLQRARDRAGKGDKVGASACARAVLVSARDLEVLLGHASFLSGDASGALAAYERVLSLMPDDVESLYARAAIRLEQGASDVEAARADLRRLIERAPNSARAVSARELLAGVSASKAAVSPSAVPRNQAPPQLSPEVIAAFQNTERTPEKRAAWARLIDEAESELAKGSCQSALDRYKQVMPYLPEDGRLRAGMAWSLVCLKRQPMAERVWGVAVSSDPAAVERLGDTLAARGNSQGAKAVYAKLTESAPEYAERAGLARKR